MALASQHIAASGFFDLMDIDGSGTISSLELHNMVQICRGTKQGLEIAGCHLRLKDLQEHIRTKLAPQLNKLQQIISLNASVLEGAVKKAAREP